MTEEQSVKDEYLYTAYSLDGGSISRVNSVLYKEDAAVDGRNVEYRKADIEAAFDEDTGAYSMVRGVFELDETGAVKEGASEVASWQSKAGETYDFGGCHFGRPYNLSV